MPDHRYEEGLPGEEEQSGERSDVERNHDEGGNPDNWLGEGFVVREEPGHLLIYSPMIGQYGWESWLARGVIVV
jgi:hypothetical protein